MQQFEAEQWLPYPVETVFAFFSEPKNLPRILPPAQQARIEELRLVRPPGGPTGAAGTGSEIVISLRAVPPFPFRALWIARITAFHPNQYFQDEQVQGPFRSWRHRHEFRAEERDGQMGTLARDLVDYDLGWGPLGRIAATLFIRPQLRRTFRHRQQALERLLQEK